MVFQCLQFCQCVKQIQHGTTCRTWHFLGVDGLEGESSQYAKLKGIDTRILVRELQSHGIRILGTSIIGMENHSPSNIDQVIDYTVSHATDFHQFMLYTALPDSGKDRPRRLAGNPGRGGQNVSSNRFGHATMRHITLSF